MLFYLKLSAGSEGQFYNNMYNQLDATITIDW